MREKFVYFLIIHAGLVKKLSTNFHENLEGYTIGARICIIFNRFAGRKL